MCFRKLLAPNFDMKSMLIFHHWFLRNKSLGSRLCLQQAVNRLSWPCNYSDKFGLIGKIPNCYVPVFPSLETNCGHSMISIQ